MSQNESSHFPTANSIYWYRFLIRCSVNKRICCKVFNAFPIGRIGAFTTHTRWTSSRTKPKRCRPKRFHRRRFHRIRFLHHRAAGSWKKMPGFSDSVDLLVGCLCVEKSWESKKSTVKRSSKNQLIYRISMIYVDSGHARWDEWKSSITRSIVYIIIIIYLIFAIYIYIYVYIYIYIFFFHIFLSFNICTLAYVLSTWMGICRGNHEGLGVGFSNQKCI